MKEAPPEKEFSPQEEAEIARMVESLKKKDQYHTDETARTIAEVSIRVRRNGGKDAEFELDPNISDPNKGKYKNEK